MLSGCMNIIEQGVRWLGPSWFGSKKKRFRETLYIYFAWRSRGPPVIRGIAMIQVCGTLQYTAAHCAGI